MSCWRDRSYLGDSAHISPWSSTLYRYKLVCECTWPALYHGQASRFMLSGSFMWSSYKVWERRLWIYHYALAVTHKSLEVLWAQAMKWSWKKRWSVSTISGWTRLFFLEWLMRHRSVKSRNLALYNNLTSLESNQEMERVLLRDCRDSDWGVPTTDSLTTGYSYSARCFFKKEVRWLPWFRGRHHLYRLLKLQSVCWTHSIFLLEEALTTFGWCAKQNKV